jgi:hypothetical protein
MAEAMSVIGFEPTSRSIVSDRLKCTTNGRIKMNQNVPPLDRKML